MMVSPAHQTQPAPLVLATARRQTGNNRRRPPSGKAHNKAGTVPPRANSGEATVINTTCCTMCPAKLWSASGCSGPRAMTTVAAPAAKQATCQRWTIRLGPAVDQARPTPIR